MLLPSDDDLANFAAHAPLKGVCFTDASDHIVSQALYFDDPEGNGVEVYADRPLKTWRWHGTRVEMDSIPIDVAALASKSSGLWRGFPDATRMGHIHLRVADLNRSEAWYRTLGLVTTASIPGARFMSWNGYHHQVGINVWSGAGVEAVYEGAAGLAGFAIRGASREDVQRDPDGIRVARSCATPSGNSESR